MSHPETTRRHHPIDIIDGVLRPLLGSLPATQAAVTIWHALRKADALSEAYTSEGTFHRPEIKL